MRSSPGLKKTPSILPSKSALRAILLPFDADLAAVFKDLRLDVHRAEAGFGEGGDAGALLPGADHLPVLAGAGRGAGTQVKDGFGAVGLALRIAAVQDIDALVKGKGLVLVISEVLEGKGP